MSCTYYLFLHTNHTQTLTQSKISHHAVDYLKGFCNCNVGSIQAPESPAAWDPSSVVEMEVGNYMPFVQKVAINPW